MGGSGTLTMYGPPPVPYGSTQYGWGAGGGGGTGTTCSGSVTVAFTWQPDFAGDLPPARVFLIETCTAYAAGYGIVGPTLSCDNGLGSPVVDLGPMPGISNPPFISNRKQSHGTRVLVVDGGNSVTVSRTPSASASDPVFTYASVYYSASVCFADIRSVTYSGNHMVPITEDNIPENRWQDEAYGTPHWLDNSVPLDRDAHATPGDTNLDGSTNVDGDRTYPVCFQRSYEDNPSTLSVSVAIRFYPGVPTGFDPSRYRIRGYEAALYVGDYPAGNQATVSDTNLTLTNVLCKAHDGATYHFPAHIDQFTSLIEGECSLDGGATWYEVGMSDNQCYVIGGETAPAQYPSPMYETEVDIACRETTYKTTNADIVAGVFAAFVGPVPGVHRKFMDGHNVIDGTEMKYWPMGYQTDGEWPPVSVGYGKCGQWAQLLKSCLAVHGVPAVWTSVVPMPGLSYPGPPPDGGPWDPAEESGESATGFTVSSAPGQGTSGPVVTYPLDGAGLPDHFGGHVVVLVPGVPGATAITIYDPSYGLLFSQAVDLPGQKLAYQNQTFTGLYSMWQDDEFNLRIRTGSAPTNPPLWTTWQ